MSLLLLPAVCRVSEGSGRALRLHQKNPVTFVILMEQMVGMIIKSTLFLEKRIKSEYSRMPNRIRKLVRSFQQKITLRSTTFVLYDEIVAHCAGGFIFKENLEKEGAAELNQQYVGWTASSYDQFYWERTQAPKERIEKRGRQ